jgi:hypothetical protein
MNEMNSCNIDGIKPCQRFAHFQEFMHGLKKPYTSCFGNTDYRKYLCPSPSPSPSGLSSITNSVDCFNQKPNFDLRSDQMGNFSRDEKNPNNLGTHRVCSKDNQTGGAFSAFESALDVDINDPVYNRCETVVHLTPSYLEGPVYGNLADTYNLRTNFRPSKQLGLNVSTVRGTPPQTGPIMQTSLCGDRQRCGNGACAPTQKGNPDSCITGCKKINLPSACSNSSTCAWDNRVLTSPWVYGQATADIPTYYYDLSGETVGARPQFRAGTNNSIPPMMLINQTNLLGKQFGCRQPCWQSNCL